jgi:hypothetical protein
VPLQVGFATMRSGERRVPGDGRVFRILLDQVLQHDAPTGPKQKSNWLPAPEGNFYMVLRMYGPEKQIIDGSWKSPPVELVK